ncbi:hypothetical protein ACN47E_005024 [Coniothyrium glycines]
MAFNNWEKLAKAQRDYPKPKFAVAVVDKALKKNPANPFLLAWKVDLVLQLRSSHCDDIIKNINNICSQSGLNDTRFLSYLYRLCADTRRRTSASKVVWTVGIEWLKPWQNAVKAASRKSERQDLWNALFLAAVGEDQWEDVRIAVTNYYNDSNKGKEVYYTRILAQLGAALQKRQLLGGTDKMSDITLDVTRKQMKAAFEAKPDDSIAIKDIRDLRFMADVYAKQDRCNELFALWDNPPNHLEQLMRTHRDDISSLKTRLLRQQEDWPLLEQHCLSVINETIVGLEITGTSDRNPTSIWQLCAWNYDVWDSLMAALKNQYSEQEMAYKLSDYMLCCFGAGPTSKERPIQLTYLALCRSNKAPILNLCKEYWDFHYKLPSCFNDLARSLETLSVEEQKDFHRHTRDHLLLLRSSVETEADLKHLLQAELHTTKMLYLFTISMPVVCTFEAFETVAGRGISLCAQEVNSSDAAFVAIYTLLQLHHMIVGSEKGEEPFHVTSNSRLLIQAAMLARHLIAQDKNKENRTLALLAARIHLNLGLGTIAFQLWQYAKCKEMLLDTLSPYILSRISITHPFDVPGRQGFSATEELTKVITTIERMERKTDAFIFNEMPNFLADQIDDAMTMKHKFKTSLTKHICAMERRRITRLKGDAVDELPLFHAYAEVSDNVDRSVFPNFESSDTLGPLPFVIPCGIPSSTTVNHESALREDVCNVLFKETSFHNAETWGNRLAQTSRDAEPILHGWAQSPDKIAIFHLWASIFSHTGYANYPFTYSPYPDKTWQPFKAVKDIREAMEKLRMPSGTALEPEDEPTMFHENMLMCCYSILEVLRALVRLVALLREKVTNAKSTHPMKKDLPKGFVDNLEKETRLCYDAVRDVARSYIVLLGEKGVAAIKAQVRWGPTGEALRQVLSDEDIVFYARQYVDSATEAWSGVLKVKL